MRSEITQASNGPGSSILIVFIADWLRIYGKSENYYQAELAKELPTSCEIIPLSNCLYHQALFYGMTNQFMKLWITTILEPSLC